VDVELLGRLHQRETLVRVSVVVPVYNGAATIADCLRALGEQSLPNDAYEIIVVDDGSTDGTVDIAREFDVRLILQDHKGAPAARNAGIRAAFGRWVAFTDSDVIPSRTWLARLLRRVEDVNGNAVAFGAAGPIQGYESKTPAARFVDISGGLNTERHLSHPRFPFAPSGNVMYLRSALLDAGGFDERFASYDACDLHLRLRESTPLPFHFEPSALVWHRHRATWEQYWRQQRGYGVGYAQFLLRHHDRVYWGIADEVRALWTVATNFVLSTIPGTGDEALLRRGFYVRTAAQRVGFVTTFFSARERKRWGVDSAGWAPAAIARRVFTFLSRPGDVLCALRIALFVARLPKMLERRDLPSFLRELRARRTGRVELQRVLRLRSGILRMLRRYDTCYARAFALYRFLAVDPERVELRLGVEPPRNARDRYRGHAWILLDGTLLEGPGDDVVARSRDLIVQRVA
jgi:glycosyltransferase involved in cell wall biosynthesis